MDKNLLNMIVLISNQLYHVNKCLKMSEHFHTATIIKYNIVIFLDKTTTVNKQQ